MADVFLASSTRIAEQSGPPARSGLRWEAWGASGENAEKLFVAEYAWPDVHRRNFAGLDIATRLIEQVRRSKSLICLLQGASSGSPMKPREVELSTTFFELELFQAIVLERPIYLLVHRSFEPQSIECYLDLLEFGFPGWRGHLENRLSDTEALSAISKIIGGKGRPWKLERSPSTARTMHTGLFRARDHFARNESSPRIHFLQLDRQVASASPNLEAIADLMRNRRSFEEETNNDRRLAFSWLLTRELMAAPLLNGQGEVVQRDSMILSAWNAALKDWHGAASWFGLHSNIHIGTLPTLGTLEHVRRALRESGNVDAYGGPTGFPSGDYASSYYSLAKRVQPDEKKYVLDLARRVLRIGWSDRLFFADPNNLALLGSIALEDGRAVEAVGNFDARIKILERSDAKPRAIGEAMCELAFARLFVGQSTRALGEANEGIRLMQAPGTNGTYVVDGFLVRAMIKTAAINLRCGAVGRGTSLYWKALEHAKKHHLDDQVNQWKPTALVANLSKRLWYRITSSTRAG